MQFFIKMLSHVNIKWWPHLSFIEKCCSYNIIIFDVSLNPAENGPRRVHESSRFSPQSRLWDRLKGAWVFFWTRCKLFKHTPWRFVCVEFSRTFVFFAFIWKPIFFFFYSNNGYSSCKIFSFKIYIGHKKSSKDGTFSQKAVLCA